jgi:hypothetical protein
MIVLRLQGCLAMLNEKELISRCALDCQDLIRFGMKRLRSNEKRHPIAPIQFGQERVTIEGVEDF